MDNEFNKLEKIKEKELFYYRQRYKNRVFASIASLFSRLAETNSLTKKDLAFRLGKEPAQITRWFSGPSNWTLDTISDLLLAMGAEFDLNTVSIMASESHRAKHSLAQLIDDGCDIIPLPIRVTMNVGNLGTLPNTSTDKAFVVNL